ncbi:hypothetical protein [Micromonospora sp. HUAS LYJ1]|uniref:hypothetical protein n=1 Tax=Micromonospora sp. HUAS LYJ1 TaxID=3061626 RepID=UPI0026712922|nr:hypothetical protein [Micromonospora sp. HUAS LYJ1]WKU03760.1 hypothetical protein Q2K16_23390 [Micromonospora sp. HUAS LYJ1]WKU08017.1 hypothetical protein Q2K16_13795 [Micromonospora sp. HUAS LYJ1]
MTTDAGDYITPSRLNPVAFQLQLGSNYTLTTTATDLTLTNVTPGYSSGTTSIVVPEGGMVGLAVWQGDFQLTTSATVTAATLDLTIDGAIPTGAPQALFDPGNVTDMRLTPGASWPFALAAGSHSFGLRASITPSTSNVRLNARHTCLSILLHP